MNAKLRGLVAATHTPFHRDGQLNLAAVEKQAEHLLRSGITAVYIAGSTGESHSLTVEERLALARRWSEVARGSPLHLVIHVGANCLADARTLAAQAQHVEAFAIAALSPSYFKPKSLDVLVACCAEIARAAPALPFYYYEIPVMTGVRLPMPDFLELAPDRVPTLAGIKFSDPDLMAYQRCLHARGGRFDILWGTDEYLLAAMAVGAAGAVGSTYNFAAPPYHRMIAAFSRGDLATARTEQYRAVQLIGLLAEFGFLAASKATMGFLGIDVGPIRLPNANLTSDQEGQLRAGLEQIGYFDWIRT